MALPFISRRSPVLSTRGMVASSQPLATEAGVRILQQGGNAADAAVAMAACLNVTEPCSTGIGGDAFALLYSAKTQTVHCVLGNGRSPKELTLDLVQQRGHKDVLAPFDALTVTVPGAAAAWADIVDNFGQLTLKEVLAPAIRLAEEGYPVSPITAHHWARGVSQLLNGGAHAGAMLVDGKRAPEAGEVMTMPLLARTFRLLADRGKAGFYQGEVAEAVVDAVRARGGVLSLDDLAAHTTAFDKPIYTTYKGLDIWEVPPPTHGLAALIGLNIIEAAGGPGKAGPVSVDRLHLSIEAMRLAFADALQHIADPHHGPCPVEGLLSKEHAKARAELIDDHKCVNVTPGIPPAGGSDTVYFCAVDGEGNACSMINSNYMGFGTGITPEGCGFTLQNRGQNFSLDPAHPNCLAPSKRPYHTIIPGLATYTRQQDDANTVRETSAGANSLPGLPAGDLYAAFGVMGGFMQPQGHVQVICNMVDYGMDPQEALDAPRFSLTNLPGSSRKHCAEGVATSSVLLEDGEGATDRAAALFQLGHQVRVLTGHDRAAFGRGQIIRRDQKTGVLWGGSDPRADGCALGF